MNHVWLLLIFIFLRKFKEQKQAEIVCGCAQSVEGRGSEGEWKSNLASRLAQEVKEEESESEMNDELSDY